MKGYNILTMYLESLTISFVSVQVTDTTTGFKHFEKKSRESLHYNQLITQLRGQFFTFSHGLADAKQSVTMGLTEIDLGRICIFWYFATDDTEVQLFDGYSLYDWWRSRK